MAIKMDGHTITALQLKASDGSEVTKQLTEEGTIPTPTGSLSITANGTYDVTDKASAVVNVPAPEINLQNKTATANGEVTADEGYDGLGTVTVAVSGDTPTYQEKTATANGVVLPDEGYDALSKVTVNVPAPVLPTLTNPASASDILSGKEALDGDGAKLTGTCTFDADTSDADAVASDIAQGKTAYVNGAKVVGTASGGGGAANVDRGTFSVETETNAQQYSINHSLGVIPRGFVIWTDDLSTFAAQTGNTLMVGFANIDEYAEASETDIVGGHIYQTTRLTSGNINNWTEKIARTSVGNFATLTTLRYYGNVKYAPNITYKWIAWA